MVRTKEDYQIERNIKRKSEKRKAEEKEMRHTIEYREKKKFTKIEDIIKVSGIGKKTFEKIKNDITVE